jgi:membrane protein YdbS with pleckstrin-like domain
MSELDWQKTRIDVYKELFKIVVALTVAIAAGIASMIMLNQFGLLFWAAIAVLVVMVLISIFSFQILLKEVDKLKDI